MRYLLVAILSLSGCASYFEHYDNLARQQQEQREAAYRESLNQQCISLGFRPGTESYSNCLLQLHANAQNQAAGIRNALILRQIR